MANKLEYINRLERTVEHLHKCIAVYVDTAHVKEVFQGATLWEGDVEIFRLSRHPKAKRCFAWSDGEPEEIITILELPPVDSPESAVKLQVAQQIKKARKERPL